VIYFYGRKKARTWRAGFILLAYQAMAEPFAHATAMRL
jgi:hypothetical protein